RALGRFSRRSASYWLNRHGARAIERVRGVLYPDVGDLSCHRQHKTGRSIMPGWYIHMEVAKKMVDALRAGQVGPEFPVGQGKTPQDWAKELGENTYKWRNYL